MAEKFIVRDFGSDGLYLDGAVVDLAIQGSDEVAPGGWRDTLAYIPDRNDMAKLYEALKYLKRKGAF